MVASIEHLLQEKGGKSISLLHRELVFTTDGTQRVLNSLA